MTPQRWQTIENLFQAAVALPADERPAFLEKACRDDPALRGEVDSLIAHDGRSADIESAVQEIVGCFSEEESACLAGMKIGAYRITGVIGRGGMGVVCAAVRDDAEFSKQVAIKLIKRGMDTLFIAGRFRAERQILASLDHPGIARLIDGGTTRDGQPYFVMEHVEGLPITSYCEVNRLSIPQRLQLFRLVCEAVQYAHRNLVVHRDIKPSNILVTQEGLPKLLDFGVAKVLDPTPSAESATQTALAVRMMTPDYASPEQVQGARVTTATDVYSLGAVLYEMLTGERAHHLSEYTPPEIERTICQTEIERPSNAVLRNTRQPERTRRQEARQLRGDLDNIALKAMRKEPERRYASVEQFSQDIHRHLVGQPVDARPDCLLYRAGKFIGRHRMPVAAAVFAVTSLAAGAVATAYQAQRAEQRFQQVRKLANVFLFDLHDRIRVLPGSTETRRFVVKTGLDYLAGLEPEVRGDIGLLRELASAYLKIGDVQGHPWQANLGDPVGAMTSYGKAAAILENLPRRRDRESLILLAETYTRIGDIRANRADWKGAVESHRKGLAIVDDLASDEADVRSLGVKALAHQRTAYALAGLADLTGVIENASKSAAVYQKLAAMDRANQLYQSYLSTSYRLWGNGLEYSGKPHEALAHYQEVLRIRNALAAREPINREFQRELMAAHANLGDLLTNAVLERPDFEGALAHNRKRLDIAELLVRQDPNDKAALSALSTALWRVGTCLRLLGRIEEALRHLRRGVEITRGALAGNPTRYALRSNAVNLEAEIALALASQEKWREALAHSRAAVKGGERLLAETPSGREVPSRNLLRFYGRHIEVLGRLGKANDVRTSSRRILELAEETHPKRTGKFVVYTAATALSAVGEAYESLARRAEIPSARLAHQREACSWFGRSLERWNDLRDTGATIGTYQTRPTEMKETLAACQAKL